MNTSDIHIATNPKNGEVTLCLSNVQGGPVVTGKDLAEAMAKLKDGLDLFSVLTSFLDLKKDFENNLKQV